MTATTTDARTIGREWAEDRHRTGSSWSQFHLDDALGAVDPGLPDQERRDLAHEICDAAAARWRELHP